MVLCIRADSPDVYIGIWDSGQEKISKTWQAGRELSTQILSVITNSCDSAGISLEQLQGVVVYEGPGSYTGLRISVSVANALAYSCQIPILGSSGDDWVASGLSSLRTIHEYSPIAPVYGGEVYTTKPKK